MTSPTTVTRASNAFGPTHCWNRWAVAETLRRSGQVIIGKLRRVDDFGRPSSTNALAASIFDTSGPSMLAANSRTTLRIVSDQRAGHPKSTATRHCELLRCGCAVRIAGRMVHEQYR